LRGSKSHPSIVLLAYYVVWVWDVALSFGGSFAPIREKQYLKADWNPRRLQLSSDYRKSHRPAHQVDKKIFAERFRFECLTIDSFSWNNDDVLP
jgi:hypothetical protein